MRKEEVDTSGSCLVPATVMTSEERIQSRYDNFYNDYNGWSRGRRKEIQKHKFPESYEKEKNKGQTLDGSRPKCIHYKVTKNKIEDQKKSQKQLPCPPTIPIALPPGISPQSIEFLPPNPATPCGTWMMKINPCSKEETKKKTNLHAEAVCKVGCLRWKSKEPPCKYDDPCPAACTNHPPGIKPSGRF